MDFKISSKLGILRCPPICATAFSLILWVTANPVMAESSHTFAMNFGSLIATAQACDIALDQGQIARVTTEHLVPGDLQFAELVSGAIALRTGWAMSASDNEKAAACTAARINAEALGILAAPP